MTIFNSYVENYQRVIISEFFDLRSDVSTTGWIQGTFWIRLAARVLYRHGTLFNIPSLVWWFWMYWLYEESRLFQHIKINSYKLIAANYEHLSPTKVWLEIGIHNYPKHLCWDFVGALPHRKRAVSRQELVEQVSLDNTSKVTRLFLSRTPRLRALFSQEERRL